MKFCCDMLFCWCWKVSDERKEILILQSLMVRALACGRPRLKSLLCLIQSALGWKTYLWFRKSRYLNLSLLLSRVIWTLSFYSHSTRLPVWVLRPRNVSINSLVDYNTGITGWDLALRPLVPIAENCVCKQCQDAGYMCVPSVPFLSTRSWKLVHQICYLGLSESEAMISSRCFPDGVRT